MLDARRDYLMRQIQELAQFVARILGLTQQSAWAEAEATLAEAYRALTGVPKELLDRVDLATLRLLLPDDDKARLVVALLDEEAKLLRAQGAAAAAARVDGRARQLEATLPPAAHD